MPDDTRPADPTPRSPSQVAATGPAGGRIVPDVPGNPQPGTPSSQKSLNDKLYLIRYRLDDRPHLRIVDPEKCREYHEDTKRPCAFFCPAHVYEWDEKEQRTIVEYERCVECGACRIEVGSDTKFACVDGPEFDGHKVNWKLARQRSVMFAEEEKRAMAEHRHEGGGCGCGCHQ